MRTGERGLRWAPTTRVRLASPALALLLLALLGWLVLGRAPAFDAGGTALAPAPGLTHVSGAVLPEGAVGPASAAIGASEPSYWAHRAGAAVSARNRNEGFRMRFTGRGATVESALGTLELRPTGAGFGSSTAALGSRDPIASANRVAYRYAGLEAWYLNGPFGLEQGFTVAGPPARAHDSGTYSVELALGGLEPSLTDRGRALELRSPLGASMRYAGLKAVDASGTLLPAWLSLDGHRLALHVRTLGARFPVTIDPILTEEGLIVELGQAEGEAPEKAAFGTSVALSADGETALVGAPDAEEHTGAAWVFHREGAVWKQLGTKLTTGEESGCEEEGGSVTCAFGSAVALSEHGDTALIGAPGSATKPGVAWVFDRSGSTWAKEALSGPTEAGQQAFGFSVALSFDRDHAVVGAPQEHGKAGAAYVFERVAVGGEWKRKPLIPSVAGGHFGYSVAISGNGQQAVVGAPTASHAGAAFAFEHSGEPWEQIGSPLSGKGEIGEGRFGETVAIASAEEEGNTVLVAAPRDNNKLGAVWTFVKKEGGWSEFGEKLQGNGAEKEEFGSGVALSANGNLAFIGAPRATTKKAGEVSGGAFLYEAKKSEWKPLEPAIEAGLIETGRGQFGRSVSMTATGETLLVGAPHESVKAGAVWLFGQRPQVVKVDPARGPTTGGRKVVITGRNLELASPSEPGGVRAVLFGGVPGEILGPPTKLTEGLESFTVVTPPGEQGQVDVTVETADWLSAETTNDHYTYVPPSEKKPGNGNGNGGGGKTKVNEVPFGQVGLVTTLPGSGGTLGGSSSQQPAACSVGLRSTRVSVDSKARARVLVVGRGSGKCGGRITLQARSGSGQNAHTRTIATGTFVVYAGRAATVTLKLNSTGRAMLHHGHGHLKAHLTILKSYPSPAKALLAAVNVLQSAKH